MWNLDLGAGKIEMCHVGIARGISEMNIQSQDEVI